MPNAKTNTDRPMLFDVGASVMLTSGFIAAIGSHDVAETMAMQLVGRHVRGDFGVTCEADARKNQRVIDTGDFDSIMSVYEVPQRVYVITDADRKMTTVLVPDEY